MMDTLYDIRDYLSDNLMTVLAGSMIVALVAGFLMFALTVIRPQLAARNELAAQVVAAQTSLAQNQASQNSVPESLNAQIASNQVRLDELANNFMSETAAAGILNSLYRYADQAGVEVSDLQAQTGAETAVPGKQAYDARVFRIQVNGDVANLLAFITQITEASVPSFAIQNVKIAEFVDAETGLASNALTMDFVLYTSPYVSDTAVADSSSSDGAMRPGFLSIITFQDECASSFHMIS